MVPAYAYHLADLFEWLHHRQLGWDAVTFDDLSNFSGALRAGMFPLEKRDGTGRSDSTMASAAR